MKKFITLLLISITASIFSQETISEYQKNELKVNVPYLLFGAPEITYERILSEDTAIGISAAIYLERENSEEDRRNTYNFHIFPYYRLYFGKKIASGFFIEGNGGIISQKNYQFNYNEEIDFLEVEKDNQIGLGLGFGVGTKFMIKKDWLIEIYGGVGRNFINNDVLDIAYPRFGLTLGKRF